LKTLLPNAAAYLPAVFSREFLLLALRLICSCCPAGSASSIRTNALPLAAIVQFAHLRREKDIDKLLPFSLRRSRENQNSLR
jgi:hypothetical protein